MFSPEAEDAAKAFEAAQQAKKLNEGRAEDEIAALQTKRTTEKTLPNDNVSEHPFDNITEEEAENAVEEGLKERE